MAKRVAILIVAAMLVGPGGANAIVPPPTDRPGFAAALMLRSVPQLARDWPDGALHAAWRAIAASGNDRQPARWRLAVILTHRGRGAEASGVLATMLHDEPQLAMIPAFRLAMGRAALALGHGDDARRWVLDPGLAGNPMACGIRLLATHVRTPALAGDVACAMPAMAGNDAMARQLRLAGARALLALGEIDRAGQMIAPLAADDAAANLWRGRIAAAGGNASRAALDFEEVQLSSDRPAAAAATVERIRLTPPTDAPAARAALDRLSHIAFTDRGTPAEIEAVDTGLAIARRWDERAWLIFAATRLRDLPVVPGDAALTAQVTARLRAALSRADDAHLADAADQLWRYRDLVNAGGGGGDLTDLIADRLAAARLPARAAELLSYRAAALPRDIEQGPISIRIARLWLTAGRPGMALHAIRVGEGIAFPAPVAVARRRLEAIALANSGATDAARALLDPRRDADIVAAMAWVRRDWATVAALPPGGSDRTARRAIAFAMLGRTQALVRLDTRGATPPVRALVAILARGRAPAGVDVARLIEQLSATTRGDAALIVPPHPAVS